MENTKKNVERCDTGIRELDALLAGGFPRGSMILLAGKSGTGKSFFGLRFLLQGAIRGEPGLYVSMEDSEEEIQAKADGLFNVQDLVKKNKFRVVRPESIDFVSLKKMLEDEIDKTAPKRVVINSLTVIESNIRDGFEARKGLADLKRKLRSYGITSLVISDMKEDDVCYSLSGYDEFVVDGVIELGFARTSKLERYILIRKMLFTNHPLIPYNYEIDKNGIRLLKPLKPLQ